MEAQKCDVKANPDNHALDLLLLLEELQASGQQQFGTGGSTPPSQASPLGPAPTGCSQPPPTQPSSSSARYLFFRVID